MLDGGASDFEAVALPHLTVVYRVALRLARDPHLAEDLVQETYLRAHKAFSTFRMREFGIRPWLLRILHNAFLNQRERQQRGPRSTDHQSMELVDTRPNRTASGGDGVIDFEQVDEEIKVAIDALRPEYRSVVLLWATMELSYQEIADALQIPIGTVMSRLHRGRLALMDALKDYAAKRRFEAALKGKQ